MSHSTHVGFSCPPASVCKLPCIFPLLVPCASAAVTVGYITAPFKFRFFRSCSALLLPTGPLPLQSDAFGVGHSCPVCNERDAFPSVRRADSRSFKIKHDGVIARALQVLDNVGSGNAQDSRYVLTNDPTRRKFSDNSEHFRP